jgi:hypothetical protein
MLAPVLQHHYFILAILLITLSLIAPTFAHRPTIIHSCLHLSRPPPPPPLNTDSSIFIDEVPAKVIFWSDSFVMCKGNGNSIHLINGDGQKSNEVGIK